jgi:hypothetical protein
MIFPLAAPEMAGVERRLGNIEEALMRMSASLLAIELFIKSNKYVVMGSDSPSV